VGRGHEEDADVEDSVVIGAEVGSVVIVAEVGSVVIAAEVEAVAVGAVTEVGEEDEEVHGRVGSRSSKDRR